MGARRSIPHKEKADRAGCRPADRESEHHRAGIGTPGHEQEDGQACVDDQRPPFEDRVCQGPSRSTEDTEGDEMEDPAEERHTDAGHCHRQISRTEQQSTDLVGFGDEEQGWDRRGGQCDPYPSREQAPPFNVGPLVEIQPYRGHVGAEHGDEQGRANKRVEYVQPAELIRCEQSCEDGQDDEADSLASEAPCSEQDRIARQGAAGHGRWRIEFEKGRRGGWHGFGRCQSRISVEMHRLHDGPRGTGWHRPDVPTGPGPARTAHACVQDVQ